VQKTLVLYTVQSRWGSPGAQALIKCACAKSVGLLCRTSSMRYATLILMYALPTLGNTPDACRNWLYFSSIKSAWFGGRVRRGHHAGFEMRASSRSGVTIQVLIVVRPHEVRQGNLNISATTGLTHVKENSRLPVAVKNESYSLNG
jgi:hypothetical protein